LGAVGPPDRLGDVEVNTLNRKLGAAVLLNAAEEA
jgi:hypothetical protein